jgi:2-iminobutanoate/2-iminopropanoate deaminase
LKNIAAILEEAGTNVNNVIKTTCFIQNMSDFAEFNAVYGEFFTGKPARSTVGAQELPKKALCEVEVVATL